VDVMIDGERTDDLNICTCIYIYTYIYIYIYTYIYILSFHLLVDMFSRKRFSVIVGWVEQQCMYTSYILINSCIHMYI
jgi:hypothetical protein